MDSLVSIIVPSYNVERYIDKCVASILSQTYKNIELIIVDDGSTDETYALAKNWRIEDQRVVVVHQTNQGSGPARNTGLKLARGQYIVFVDPDDWVENELIYSLLHTISKLDVDLVISGCINEYYKNDILIETKNISFKNSVIRGKQNIQNAYLRLFNDDAILAPTRIMYKKDIIEKHDVKFPDLRRSQDIVFNYRYYKEISSLAVMSACYYHYRFDIDEVSIKIKPDYYKSISFIFLGVREMCLSWGIDLQNSDFVTFCNHFYFPLLVAMATSKSIKKLSEIVYDDGIQDYVRFIQTKTSSLKAKLLHRMVLSKQLLLIRLYLMVWRFLKLNKTKGFSK